MRGERKLRAAKGGGVVAVEAGGACPIPPAGGPGPPPPPLAPRARLPAVFVGVGVWGGSCDCKIQLVQGATTDLRCNYRTTDYSQCGLWSAVCGAL
jgi:hypothetical protein